MGNQTSTKPEGKLWSMRCRCHPPFSSDARSKPPMFFDWLFSFFTSTYRCKIVCLPLPQEGTAHWVFPLPVVTRSSRSASDITPRSALHTGNHNKSSSASEIKLWSEGLQSPEASLAGSSSAWSSPSPWPAGSTSLSLMPITEFAVAGRRHLYGHASSMSTQASVAQLVMHDLVRHVTKTTTIQHEPWKPAHCVLTRRDVFSI